MLASWIVADCVGGEWIDKGGIPSWAGVEKSAKSLSWALVSLFARVKQKSRDLVLVCQVAKLTKFCLEGEVGSLS